MSARVLDVGQCDPDHASIRGMLETHFDAAVDRAHRLSDALAKLGAQRYDLVLVNRLLDQDQSPGMDLIASMQADDALKSTPIMLVSNFDDAQTEAVAAGALRGFGKRAIQADETLASLSEILPRRAPIG